MTSHGSFIWLSTLLLSCATPGVTPGASPKTPGRLEPRTLDGVNGQLTQVECQSPFTSTPLMAVNVAKCQRSELGPNPPCDVGSFTVCRPFEMPSR